MSGEGVPEALRRALRRRGATPALLVAAGVLAVLLAQGVLLGAIDSIAVAGLPGAGASLGYLWAGQLTGSLTGALPLAIGVFLSLWQLAPIGPELRLGQVVARALLATAIGMLLVVAVVVIVQSSGVLTGVSLFGNSFPDVGGPLRAAWFGILQGVAGAFRSLVLDAPLVVLAGVLLWGWQRRRPLAGEPAGAVDEP